MHETLTAEDIFYVANNLPRQN